MIDTFSGNAFFMGALGAMLHEATRWVGLRFDNKLPAYFHKLHYWLLTGVLIVIGGVLAGYLVPQTLAQALFIGISAPAIISRIGAAYPKQLHLAGGRDLPQPTTDAGLRGWLKG